MYEIDKDIPVPSKNRNMESKYPFKSMEVGDSFFIPLFNDGSLEGVRREKRTVTSSLYSAVRSTKGAIKITVRTINGYAGLRVWRVK